MALYCGEVEEGQLLQYLTAARDPLGRPLYDAQYALRLVRQRNRMHASVALFCELSMFEASHTSIHLIPFFPLLHCMLLVGSPVPSLLSAHADFVECEVISDTVPAWQVSMT